jgi:hypothetical protein
MPDRLYQMVNVSFEYHNQISTDVGLAYLDLTHSGCISDFVLLMLQLRLRWEALTVRVRALL